jgi:hypothetical protein
MLSSDASAELARKAAASSEKWLHFEERELRAKYNREPFLITHRLHENPLCDLTNLFQLCYAMPQGNVSVRSGVVPHNANVDTVHEDSRYRLSIDEATRQLQDKQAHIIITNPEVNPTYQQFIEQCVGEIVCAVRPLDSNFTWFSTYFFISAGDALTPYHMDREMNFLLQIRGKKKVQLWSPFDERVMSPQERDRLFSSWGTDSRPLFKDETIDLARVFELTAGVGVHHPFIAPHIVRTSSAVSVSLAITFRTEKSDIWADAHRFNQLARKLGVKPRPAREIDWIDRSKAQAIRFARKVRHSY